MRLDELRWYGDSNMWNTAKVGQLQIWTPRSKDDWSTWPNHCATFGNYYIVLRDARTGSILNSWMDVEPLMAQCLLNHYGSNTHNVTSNDNPLPSGAHSPA